MSKNIAISCDGVSDTFLKKTKNVHMLVDLWQADTVKIIKNIGKYLKQSISVNTYQRMIQTNNYFEQFIKFMELRFKGKIDDYMLKRMTIKQNGFAKGGGTSINLFNIFQQLQKYKKYLNVCLFSVRHNEKRKTLLNSEEQKQYGRKRNLIFRSDAFTIKLQKTRVKQYVLFQGWVH